MKDDFLMNLNHKQRQAVELTEGPSIILAGAGSGKTRVLIYKVLNLIQNEDVDPKRIMMVTFTNKAAAEMKKRVRENLGFIGTFHSFCVRVLRNDGELIGLKDNFVIYDDNDQKDLLKKLLEDDLSLQKHSINFYLNQISSAKNQLLSPEQYLRLSGSYSKNETVEVYRRYQAKLKKNNAVDFDDLIYLSVKLFSKKTIVLNKYQSRYQYYLVDEFQDTNHSQYMLMKYLAQKSRNITVVGDFSQSIYSWRGAELQNLERFKEDFPGTITFSLEENYRSTQNILDFAYDVISKNQSHPILKLFTSKSPGDNVEIKELENEQYEALFVADEAVKMITSNGSDLSSVAVLYRINAQSRVIEEAFLHMGIPYVLIGGTRFYERKEIKDVLSYLRLIVNPNDEIANSRVMKIGKQRFSKFKALYAELKSELSDLTTASIIEKILNATNYLDLYKSDSEEDIARLENIKELRSVAINFPDLNGFLEQIALVESEYSVSEKNFQQQEGKKGISMMTLHQAKGLEFPYVFIVGVEDGILPHSRSMDDTMSLEEERRLFYVGITRAMKKLFITHTKRRFFFGRRGTSQISRFLISNDDENPKYENQDYF